MFSSGERGIARRIDDDAAARQAFADVVVGVAFERERDALGEKCPEALSGGTMKSEPDGVVGQPG